MFILTTGTEMTSNSIHVLVNKYWKDGKVYNLHTRASVSHIQLLTVDAIYIPST